MEEVYEFMYTSCIHESAAATLSIHRTRKGAEIAMEQHKYEKRKEYDRRQINAVEFGEFERWEITKTKVLE